MPTGIYKRKPLSKETKRRISVANTGKKRTVEVRLRKSESLKGLRPVHLIGYRHSAETRKKIGKIGKGRPKSKNAYSFPIGETHPNWKGGLGSLHNRGRHSFKYRQWRSDIFTRDNFTCQWCGKRGGNLEAHHIKEWSTIIKTNNIKTIEEIMCCEELWDINNGVTLCCKCHYITKKYGRK